MIESLDSREDLVDRTARRSQRLLDDAAEVIPGGVNTCRRRSEPRLCFARGAGAHLWDLDGRRYVDYHAAYGAILLGHCHPAVTDRVARGDRASASCSASASPRPRSRSRADRRARAVRRAGRRLQQRLGGHLPRHPPRPRRHRARADRQVPGLLQRLPRLRAAQRAQRAPELVGRRDPQSKGMLEAAVDATLVCRFNDLDDVEATRRRGTREQIAAIILEPIAHNAPGPPARARLPRGPARALRPRGRRCSSSTR